jgi:hypothetical protein
MYKKSIFVVMGLCSLALLVGCNSDNKQGSSNLKKFTQKIEGVANEKGSNPENLKQKLNKLENKQGLTMKIATFGTLQQKSTDKFVLSYSLDADLAAFGMSSKNVKQRNYSQIYAPDKQALVKIKVGDAKARYYYFQSKLVKDDMFYVGLKSIDNLSLPNGKISGPVIFTTYGVQDE